MKKTIITREDGQPYLIRYKLFGNKWCRIRVHHILLSDYDCLHDHPWNFLSIILKGGYTEKTTNGATWYGPGRILYRKAEWKHSLELPEGKSAWTLVFMFKRRRQWGFWTKQGWLPWFKYKSTQTCDE